ncbi:MAG: ROK family protein [Actinobacteria bacterium]|nr:ROK family protein [Actinomycetota bacterium]
MAVPNAIGVDVGGSKIRVGTVDADGNILERTSQETPTGSQPELLDAIEAAVRPHLSNEIAAVGFGIPARVDRATGLARGAVNIPLDDLYFAQEMERRLGVPVRAENDGSAATLAEHRLGAGRGANDLVLLALGTGVGAGVVIDGALYRGWTELGHIVIVEGGEPCQGACTGRGHVESYCSGPAADRLAQRVLGMGATARDLIDRRHPALDEIGAHLGTAIGSLINIFDPQVVVIGGGFGVAAGELLFPAALAAMEREALGGWTTKLALAELGADAGLIGAGLVAFEAQ